MYTDLTILITGGTGFIGRNIVNRLLTYNPKKLIIFDRNIKHFFNDARVVYIQGNLLTDLNVLNDVNFDICFHQAANVDTTCEDNELMINTNFESFKNLIQICETKNSPIIYASSAATYGESPAPNQVGKGEFPLNIYGKSKLMMDEYVRNNSFNISIIGLRYFNVYGPGEEHKGKMMSMISQMTSKIKENKDVHLFEFGEQLRDFVHVYDIASYNLLCGNLVLYTETKYKYILNCGTGVAVSFKRIFEILKQKFLNSASKIIYIKNPHTFYQNFTQADISETVKLLKFTPVNLLS